MLKWLKYLCIGLFLSTAASAQSKPAIDSAVKIEVGADTTATQLPRRITINGLPLMLVPGVDSMYGLFGKYPQPYIYEHYWKRAMACTNLYVPKKYRDAVQFYYVNAAGFEFADEFSPFHYFAAYTFPISNQIYVSAPYLQTPNTIEHEMIHWLLFQYGKPSGHPAADPWLKKCGLI